MQNITFLKNIHLNYYTTIQVGGLAEYFAEPSYIEEFISLIKWTHENNKKCQIIGAGSNLLINNILFEGLTICTKKMRSVSIDPSTGIVVAESGVMLPYLANLLAKNGLQGGEWTIGIPGTVGGAMYMNAGSGNISLANNLVSLKVIDPTTLNIFEIEKKDIAFSYRFSPFQENKLIILSSTLQFQTKGNIKKLQSITKNKLKLKTETQPYHLPSFGSVFKNPKNLYAGKLIEELGLKGLRIGGAEISKMHANFIVNNSSASSKDIFELITVIQQIVLQKKGIFLEPEVRMIGFDYP